MWKCVQWQVAVRVTVSGERDADAVDAMTSEEPLLPVLTGEREQRNNSGRKIATTGHPSCAVCASEDWINKRGKKWDH